MLEKTQYYYLLPFATVLIFFVGGCGNNPSSSTTGVNNPPNIQVNDEIKTVPDREITISAKGSDPENNALSYSWTLFDKPNPSDLTEKLGSSSTISFTADIAGDYKIELTVSDGNNESKDTLNVTAQQSLGSEINERTILNSQYEYRITEKLTINAPLIIEPGTKVFVDSIDYDIRDEVIFIRTDYRGYISAEGTEENPIIIKGLNNRPWAGITLSENEEKNILTNVIIKDAVTYDPVANPNVIAGHVPRAILDIRGGKATIENIIITKSEDTNSLDTRLPIVNLRINEQVGFDRFNNNKFNSNIVIAPNQLSILENKFELDGKIGIMDIAVDSIVLSDFGNPYKIVNRHSGFNNESWEISNFLKLKENVDITLSTMQLEKSAILKMEEGTSLIFDGGALEANGKIITEGTSNKPVLLTSTGEERGSWLGLQLYNKGNKIKHTTIGYAGATPNTYALTKSNIALYEEASLELQNSTISESSGWGVWVSENSNLTESDNQFNNCDLGQIGYE